MTTLRETLVAAGRALLVAVVPASSGHVINAGSKGPRPAKPYVTVRCTSPGGLLGPAERVDGLDGGGVPITRMRQRREASVSFQAYGIDAADWLDAMQLNIDSEASLAAQALSSIAAVLQTPVTDISTLLDTAEEGRYSLELRFRYIEQGDAQTGVELLHTELTGTLKRYSSDPDTLPVDLTLDADGNPE